MTEPAPVSLLANHLDSIELLRKSLERNNFTSAGLHQALGADMATHLKRSDLPLYERRLRAKCELSTLIRLFNLQLPVSHEEAQKALSPLSLTEATFIGLIQLAGEQVKARVTLSFCEGLWLAHDVLCETPGELAPDHVLGPSPAAHTLARLVVRTPVRTALDIGTGCGVQALLCARHSDQVIATDTNPRALNYTLFNSRLNRLPNLECRQGSLFEPVAGSRFDLIVCNPPFVISPESEYLFRDSGLPGDQLSETVVRSVPGYLAEGGFAAVLCSWARDPAEEWSLHLRPWVADNGCDAWLFHGVTQDPLGYAAGWNRGLDSVAYGESLDRWEAYYKRLGIRALSLGGIVLRRHSAGPHWLRTDFLPENSAESFSDHILRITQAEDHLATHGSESELLNSVYKMAEDQQVRQIFVCREGRLVLDRTEVQLTKGLRLQGLLGPAALQLLALCDGQQTLQDVLAKLQTMAPLRGERQTQVIALVRHLISCGFLLPRQSASSSLQATASDCAPIESQLNHRCHEAANIREVNQ